MSDLAAWLSNRLDEVEALATSAEIDAGSPWRTEENYMDMDNQRSVVAASTPLPGYTHPTYWLWNSEEDVSGSPAVAAHVAGMDPAMVLQLVAATRTLLELHKPNFRYVPMTKDRWIYLSGAEAVAMAARTAEIWKGDLECDVCGDENGGGENPRLPWPCPTLRAVAAGWGWTDA